MNQFHASRDKEIFRTNSEDGSWHGAVVRGLVVLQDEAGALVQVVHRLDVLDHFGLVGTVAEFTFQRKKAISKN